ncbi:Glycerophosphodiester phosphodiesterase domain [Dillenia turbinata]|uniref:glycerophosphodiester phosphodiesterase n=1 Tax=Dillenia turbinata TaxID=194707 RepID=A0AAN8ZAI6_9MAGN
MALKAVHVSEVPNLINQVPEAPAFGPDISTPSASKIGGGETLKEKEFKVIGHRGCGMNTLQMQVQSELANHSHRKVVKENSILSFNAASKFNIDFIEFDVQVAKDDCPVIFHDNFILTQEEGVIVEKRVTELTLKEFLGYGVQREPGNTGKAIYRKTKNGKVMEWRVESDDSLCTLQEVFERVHPSLGFNIELKFDDQIVYTDNELTHTIGMIMQVVNDYARDRPIIFSSFQPDAARLVFFLTNGGNVIYRDTRRNSLDEAIKLCLENGLQGIVSEVRAIFRNPEAITRMKESGLSLLTYGQLNNVPEAAYMQYLMGVEGVIVDLLQEIREAVSEFMKPVSKEGEDDKLYDQDQHQKKLHFSQRELSFLLKLIPELTRG